LRNVIRQTVVMLASPEALFEMYLDPASHQAITGAPVVIGGAKGALFEAFNGSLSGKIIDIVRPSLIVQFWRSTEFKETDPDSILILSFAPEGDQGRIDLIQLDVPDHDFEGVTKGWEQYYWGPWRAYLEGKGEFA
jgi:activator of HSP90 ATPase